MANKNLKNAYKKHLREKKLLIRFFVFCAFAWLFFVLIVLLVRAKFLPKNILQKNITRTKTLTRKH